MALKIIGAGFGRTGTDSMREALNMLGFGPCYHMYEVLPHPDRVDIWRAAAQGDLPDWDAVFAEYNATVDWPGAAFWCQLADHYPDAKILLTRRDSDAWYASMANTILKVLSDPVADPDAIGNRLLRESTFKGNVTDRDHVIACYEAHNAAVQAAFGPDRLLTYELGSGWKPLCAFLGVPVPEEPFPRSNDVETFHDRLERMEAERAAKRSGA